MRRTFWAGYLVSWVAVIGFAVDVLSTGGGRELTNPAGVVLGVAFCTGVLVMLLLARWRVRHGLVAREDPGWRVPVQRETWTLLSGIRVPEAIRALRGR